MAEPAFVGAGASVGIEAWRIENCHPVKQADAISGKLHTGDAYIILSTTQKRA